MPKRDDEKPENEKRQREEELQDLWRRRDRLNESEWDQLYKLIYRILYTQHGDFWPLLKSLPNEDFNVEKDSELASKFKAYVWEFYLEKILIPVCDRRQCVNQNQEINKTYFRRSFKNFLKDKRRYFNNRPQATPPEKIITRDPEKDDEDFDLFEYLNINQIDLDWRPSPDQEWTLWNFGFDLSAVTASARDFFNQLTPEDQLLFKERFVERKPLKDLREKIPNVYYAASRLGINKNKQQFPDYHNTRIGKWLADMGLFLDRYHEIDPDELAVLVIVLQILRACALDGVDADRRSGSGTGPADPPQPDA